MTTVTITRKRSTHLAADIHAASEVVATLEGLTAREISRHPLTRTARSLFRQVSSTNGAGRNPAMLTHDSAKIRHNAEGAPGWLEAILYASPARVPGFGNACQHSTPECRANCLAFTGLLAVPDGQRALLTRREMITAHLPETAALLMHEITAHVERCQKVGARPAIRLNGTTDYRWEIMLPALFDAFPAVQFLDYTKTPNRTTPPNYYLVRSATERTNMTDPDLLATGNVVVVARIPKDAPVPPTLWGHTTVDGDAHDLRHLDPLGHLVVVRAKGKLARNASPFARSIT